MIVKKNSSIFVIKNEKNPNIKMEYFVYYKFNKKMYTADLLILILNFHLQFYSLRTLPTKV